MSRTGRYGRSKAAALLAALSLAAGLLTTAITLPLLGVAGLAGRDVASTFNALPVVNPGQLPARSELVDSSGHLIAYYYPRNIYRVPVTFDEIAPVMRNAIVAIEDSRFYQHGALDLHGTIRALTTTLSSGTTQGGSDLAQQYVKNACILTSTTLKQILACKAVTVTRKLRELRGAADVMREMTRPQLLAAYLNAAYFENQAYGIDVAARLYFSTSPGRLSLTESAMLAGIVQNPVAFDPLLHPQATTRRRNVVLTRMAQLGYITRAVASSAEGQPLGLHVSRVPLQTGCISPAARRAAFFCDYVLSVMKHDPFYAKAWTALNLTGGLTIRTTLGPGDQSAAQNAVSFVEPWNSGYYNPGHNADTEVLIEPGTGYVRAIAVNRPFGDGGGKTTVDYAVNTPYGASAGVQTGSSSKLFTLVTALKKGLPFGYHLRVTSPTTVGPYYSCRGTYVPPFPVINAEGPQGAKTYTIYDGTVQSINAFYATLEQRVGLCDVVRTAASMGLTRADGTSLLLRDPHLPAGNNLSVDHYPSFTLGSVYVSPMSMAAAYATLAARGVYCAPVAISAITSSDGSHFPVRSARCHRVMSKGVADAANYVLQGVLGGSGTAFNRGIGIHAAAKTGTANGGFYAAFAGYTPRLTGYVSVFNPVDPTSGGRMVYPRADYREANGAFSAPSQMFGDNAPGATWQRTFLTLHLADESFHYPPLYPFFDLPLTYVPPHKKHKPTPSPSASATKTTSQTPTPTTTPTPSPSTSPSPAHAPGRSPARSPGSTVSRPPPLAVVEQRRAR